jgi:nitrate reductase NapAB chaperone NapD
MSKETNFLWSLKLNSRIQSKEALNLTNIKTNVVKNYNSKRLRKKGIIDKDKEAKLIVLIETRKNSLWEQQIEQIKDRKEVFKYKKNKFKRNH